MAEVEETCKRIQSMRGVQGILITNGDGIPIKSTVSDPVHLAFHMKLLADHASRAIKDLDNQNDLCMLRIHTKAHEIMCCTDPSPQGNFMMTVIHENTKAEGQCQLREG